MKRHKVLTGIGALALIGAMGNAFGSDTDPAAGASTDTSASEQSVSGQNDGSTAAPDEEKQAKKPKPATPKPTNPYGPQPSQQLQFIDAANRAMDDYASASNDLKAGAALVARNDRMCSLIGAGQVAGWTGTVTTLDSNGDGYGIVTVEIAPNVEVSTWNNAFSDIMDDTLIKPGSLLTKLLTYEEGDTVRFAGQFRPDSDTCVNDSRLTQAGKVEDPSFIFRFADINPAS
jgi:hypothetical protein